MNKVLLLISLSLIVPSAYATDLASSEKNKAKKKVTFDLQPQVRTFKKEKQEETKPEQAKAIVQRPTAKSRISDGFLGVTMLWAGPFAMAMAIKHNGDNNVFMKVVSGGALLSGLVVTLAGFEKIKAALW